MIYFKIIIASILAVNALSQIFNHKTWWFIQNVNLIFHEAGHIIFIPFGHLPTMMGGSILEISIPLIVTLHFIYTKQFFSAACTCWWLSTAFLSVSIYISDAQERILPLITNDIDSHDWFNILNELNILKYDNLIGYVFWCLSVIAVIFILILLFKDKDIQNLSHQFNTK